VGDGPWSASAQSDRQSGTVSIAKLAQTRQIYDNQFDCVADEYNRDIPVTVIQANKDMRRDAMMSRFTWSNVSEADRCLWDQPSTLGTSPKCVVSLPDVMIDDPDHVVSLAEFSTGDIPEPDLLACLTDRTDTCTIPPEVLLMMTSNAINRHANDKQGSCSHLPVTDSVSDSAHITTSGGTIADGGSNCRLAGSKIQSRRLASSKMRVVYHKRENGRTMDIEAIVRQRMCRTPLGTAGTVGKTVHSVGQIEAFQRGAYDKPTRVRGQQSIPMVRSEADWYPTTLNKDEWDNLHHFSPTSAADRDPTTEHTQR
jgi:hypothetical protein